MATGKILVPSRAKADKVVTLHQTIVRKKLGSLKPEVLRQVLKEFNGLFP